MPGHDIIVIGTSSGGVEVLTRLVSRLPETLPAAVFVVLHVRPDAPSLLPAILNRAGLLPAAHAVDAEPIRTGRIYVAPPGMQMYVQRRRVAVERGPRENMHRPAIDPTFRTAAHHHGPRVIGVIASGALDDGTAGLQAVKEAGGIAVVQDPADAACASMPSHAIDRVAIDYWSSRWTSPTCSCAWCTNRRRTPVPRRRSLWKPGRRRTAPRIADDRGGRRRRIGPHLPGMQRHPPRGPRRRVLRFRCRVGHAYTSQTMLEAQGDSIERALWTAVRQLEERALLMRKLATAARERGHDAVATTFEDRSVALVHEANLLRELIGAGRALEPIESRHTVEAR